jgi:hypothetical protein
MCWMGEARYGAEQVTISHLISSNVCALFHYQYLIITQLTDWQYKQQVY